MGAQQTHPACSCSEGSRMGVVRRAPLAGAPLVQQAPQAMRLARPTGPTRAPASLTRAPAAARRLAAGGRAPLPRPQAGQEDAGLAVADADAADGEPSLIDTAMAAVRCGAACSAGSIGRRTRACELPPWPPPCPAARQKRRGAALPGSAGERNSDTPPAACTADYRLAPAASMALASNPRPAPALPMPQPL